MDESHKLWFVLDIGVKQRHMKLTKVMVDPQDDVDDVLVKIYQKLHFELKDYGITDISILRTKKVDKRYTYTNLSKDENVMECMKQYGNSIQLPWLVTLCDIAHMYTRL